MKVCPICSNEFDGIETKIYCSKACSKREKYLRRKPIEKLNVNYDKELLINGIQYSIDDAIIFFRASKIFKVNDAIPSGGVHLKGNNSYEAQLRYKKISYSSTFHFLKCGGEKEAHTLAKQWLESKRLELFRGGE